MNQRPSAHEHAPYYARYIASVPHGDILKTLSHQADEFVTFLRSVPHGQESVLHPPYTWTFKQVVGHINDGERIFAYRALRIARGDTTPLPGFDENQYAKVNSCSHRSLAQLGDEWLTIRTATLSLLTNLDAASWTRTGTANSNPISVRAIAWIIAGHAEHHIQIMRNRLDQAKAEPLPH